MIYPNKPLYLLSLLGYIYYLTYYTLTTKDNIHFFSYFLYAFTCNLLLSPHCPYNDSYDNKQYWYSYHYDKSRNNRLQRIYSDIA